MITEAIDESLLEHPLIKVTKSESFQGETVLVLASRYVNGDEAYYIAEDFRKFEGYKSAWHRPWRQKELSREEAKAVRCLMDVLTIGIWANQTFGCDGHSTKVEISSGGLDLKVSWWLGAPVHWLGLETLISLLERFLHEDNTLATAQIPVTETPDSEL